MYAHYGHVDIRNRILGAIRELYINIQGNLKFKNEKDAAWKNFIDTEAYRYNEHLLKIRDLAMELKDTQNADVADIAVQKVTEILDIFSVLGLVDAPTTSQKIK